MTILGAIPQFSCSWRCVSVLKHMLGCPRHCANHQVLSVRHFQHNSGGNGSQKEGGDVGKVIADRFIANNDIPIPNGNLPGNKFLPVKNSLLAMSRGDVPYFPHIPLGRKEDTCFMVDNRPNILKRQQRKNALYVDDCGSWVNKDMSNNYTKYYFILKEGNIQFILRIRKKYVQRDYKLGKQVALDPQPLESDVLVVLRYMSRHSLSIDYMRCITEVRYLPDCFEAVFGRHIQDSVLVQYRGRFPGYTPHGRNTKNDDPYIRLPGFVTEAVDECLERGEFRVLKIVQELVNRDLLLWTRQNVRAVQMRILANRSLYEKAILRRIEETKGNRKTP